MEEFDEKQGIKKRKEGRAIEKEGEHRLKRNAGLQSVWSEKEKKRERRGEKYRNLPSKFKKERGERGRVGIS